MSSPAPRRRAVKQSSWSRSREQAQERREARRRSRSGTRRQGRERAPEPESPKGLVQEGPTEPAKGRSKGRAKDTAKDRSKDRAKDRAKDLSKDRPQGPARDRPKGRPRNREREAPTPQAQPEREPKTVRSSPRTLLLLWVLVVGAGLAAIGVAAAGYGPPQLSPSGSVAIATAYTWALAARTGGRPLIFAFAALAAGVSVVAIDRDLLATGAAVMTSVVSAVLGVMATVPGVRFVHAAREAVIAVLVAAVGAVATVGFEPAISMARFEYVTLGLSLFGALGVVYRLGAGLHGLGTRGILTVLVGSGVLAVTLAYAEVLRRYGTPGLVETMFDGVRWSRAQLGAFPRPIEAVLGIPALTWGCHMRARRRQGWWVCVFGVAATSPVANTLMNASVSRVESGLAVLYAMVVGVVVGFVLIRLDLAFTGPRGKRGRRAEEATAIRPEPPRTSALL